MGDRKPWSTTLDRELLEAFREKCKTEGIPANIMLEMLMKFYLAEGVEVGMIKK